MHILLEKAKKYNLPEKPGTPEGYSYNKKLGYWYNSESDTVYINAKDNNPPASKKFDIETGEDQKGE